MNFVPHISMEQAGLTDLWDQQVSAFRLMFHETLKTSCKGTGKKVFSISPATALTWCFKSENSCK